MNVLVFDIETIPDTESGQAIFDLAGLDEKSTAKAMMHMHQQKTGSDFLPLHLHKIIAISLVCRGMGDDMDDLVTVRSLGDENSTELDLLNSLFDEIDAREPALVSWNGSVFDSSVIRYRALKAGVKLPSHWEQDDNHIDLKYALAGNNADNSAPLDHIAKLLGFPGKMGMDGSQVWDEYQAGNIKGIRDYCETDVLNTYLIYLRYQLMRGELNHEQLEQEFTLLRNTLSSQNKDGKTHLGAFLKAW